MEDKDKIIAELKAYMDVNEDFKKAWEELKAENEKLMAECDMYKTFYRAKHSDIKGLLLNYKQTLQEIKEIAEQILNKNEFIYMNYRDVRQIIRLITKAESEEV